MSKHPNAITSGIAGIGVGSIVVEVAAKFGFHLTAGQGVLIAGGLGSAALFFGRNGAIGTWRFVKRVFLYGTSSR